MKKLLIITAIAITISSGLWAQKNDDEFAIANGPFDPSWDSFIANNQFPEWFRDAKFGIWAHWGVQCVPEFGDWYGRSMYLQNSGTNKHHVEKYGHPSEFGLMEFIPRWKAEKWNPEVLMKLYKKAGAKYFVAMANHHDNFDNYDSKYQPWNSVNMGPKKDIIGDWEKIARKEGLRFGVSNHSAHAWHWNQVAYGYDAEGDKAGVRYDAYGLKKEDGKGKWWEGYDPKDLYTNPLMVIPDGIRSLDSMNKWHEENDRIWDEKVPVNNREFAKTWYLRAKELVDKYKPDLVYFDDTRLPLEEYGLNFVAHYYNSNIKNGTQQVVVTTKELYPEQQKGLVLDCERGSISNSSPYPWQTCLCIGDWHYNQRTYDANRYKSVSVISKTLIDIVSKNGNLLLSIPVKSDGSLDDKELAFLEGMAKWMDIHGEGIYETRPWRIFGEGVANTKSEGSFGDRERSQASLSSKDIRFTTKGDKLYVFVLGFPNESQIVVKSLGKNSEHTGGATVKNIRMLGYTGKLTWKQNGDSLVIDMPLIDNTGCPIGFEVVGLL